MFTQKPKELSGFHDDWVLNDHFVRVITNKTQIWPLVKLPVLTACGLVFFLFGIINQIIVLLCLNTCKVWERTPVFADQKMNNAFFYLLFSKTLHRHQTYMSALFFPFLHTYRANTAGLLICLLSFILYQWLRFLWFTQSPLLTSHYYELLKLPWLEAAATADYW